MRMTSYLDITLLPNQGMNLYFLWEKLYAQLHLALVEHKNRTGDFSIAVAFPEYDSKRHTLGGKLRLLASEPTRLAELEMSRWLGKLLDYMHISSIKTVPQNVSQYVCYFRPKVLPSKQVLITRRMRRHQQTAEQAAQHYANLSIQLIKTPFINMRSHTKQHRFKLFITEAINNQNECLQSDGLFNCYGLSRQARVPKF